MITIDPSPQGPHPELNNIPDLVDQMLNSYDEEKCEDAAKQIYELCDLYHKENRVPMVCGGYDVVYPLAICLKEKIGYQRHLACLALNNLSIPFDNKPVMMHGPGSKEMLGGLCRVISEYNEGSLLGILCLMNLSFQEDCITKMLHFSPCDDGFVSPLKNPNSLLRILETILRRYPPDQSSGGHRMNFFTDLWMKIRYILHSNDLDEAKLVSHKSETLRWTYSLLKNLCRCDQNADLIGKTSIPSCIVQTITSSKIEPSSWRRGSIEDFALFCVITLSQYTVSQSALLQTNITSSLIPIMSVDNNIQGLKATLACTMLDVEWSSFPYYGIPASENISELMVDVYEKRSKKGIYDSETFNLITVTRSFRDLTGLAVRNGADQCLQILSNPKNVSVCLQIISDLILSTFDPKHGTNAQTEYIASANVIVALDTMSTNILEATDDPTTDCTASDKAVIGISELLATYADLAGRSFGAMDVAHKLSSQLQNSTGITRPILEKAHQLWNGDSHLSHV